MSAFSEVKLTRGGKAMNSTLKGQFLSSICFRMDPKPREERKMKLTKCSKVQVLVPCNSSYSSLPPSMLMMSAKILKEKLTSKK